MAPTRQFNRIGYRAKGGVGHCDSDDHWHDHVIVARHFGKSSSQQSPYDFSSGAHAAPISTGPLAGLCPSGNIQQWQPTTFADRTSGVRTVEFRGKVIYYNVPDGTRNGSICFKNLYEIQWTPRLGSHGTPPIQAGDSGAWLCVSGPNGYEWAAMAVAREPSIGFAVSASAIETWWQGLNLNLNPM